ncbi:MAG: hypothetical protein COB60_03825 [Flavobacteriaceae bacterium]|nr:MAG: hypothetical protein COB60_03825 [Flavobacteriaceae bacterium]
MNIKNIAVLFVSALIIMSCSKDKDSDSDNFDAAAQALTDDKALLDYFESHYLNGEDGEIWEIGGDFVGSAPIEEQIPLTDQVEIENVTLNDIAYKLYYLKTGNGVGAAPSRVDSVFATYRGALLDSTIFDTNTNASWFNLFNGLDGVIPGWSYGFPNFNAGEKIINPDESFDFKNNGKGWLFFPSGLGYRNDPTRSTIPENSPLMFKIELMTVNKSDHDGDGIDSIDEDLDNDGDVFNDDTDGDGRPNFADADDDGDGILTKDEDANNDGDLTNDDSDGDGTPDYLDSDS